MTSLRTRSSLALFTALAAGVLLVAPAAYAEDSPPDDPGSCTVVGDPGDPADGGGVEPGDPGAGGVEDPGEPVVVEPDPGDGGEPPAPDPDPGGDGTDPAPAPGDDTVEPDPGGDGTVEPEPIDEEPAPDDPGDDAVTDDGCCTVTSDDGSVSSDTTEPSDAAGAAEGGADETVCWDIAYSSGVANDGTTEENAPNTDNASDDASGDTKDKSAVEATHASRTPTLPLTGPVAIGALALTGVALVIGGTALVAAARRRTAGLS